MARGRALLLALGLAAGLLGLMMSVPPGAVGVDWQTKVDSHLLQMLNGDGVTRIEFLVELNEQADLTFVDSAWTKAQKGSFVTSRLRQTAASTQGPLLTRLINDGAAVQPFWVTNAIHVVAPPALIPEIASRADVRFLHPNLPIPQPDPAAGPAADWQALAANEWGIDKIGADLLWAEGISGTGAIIAGQDTGYQWNHPALIDSYRGWDSISQAADHNYTWHDAITADINGNGTNTRCGYSSAVPCDDNGHGTHTMGTMAGSIGGTGSQIGVAPAASWIGCRNMEEGWGMPATYIECFQWFLAPTDLNGQNADPAKAPHVINNSWGCPPSEGCNSGNFAVMEQVVHNLRSAGIAVVVSAGNSGLGGCGTVLSPAAIYDGAITIGATNQSDAIATFSSRGPVTVDGSNRLKPDMVAPGVAVYSAHLNGGYATLQGTSMAAPHVAGALALLISAVPEAVGHVDLLEKALAETALPLTTSQGCGGDTPSSVPNHVYGAGRINVYEARNWLITRLAAHVNGPMVVYDPSPSLPLQTPLTYTLAITHSHGLTASQPVTASVDLPTNTALVTATTPFSLTGQTLTWPISDLPVGQSAALTLSLRLSDTVSTSPFQVDLDLFSITSPGTPSISLPYSTTIWHTPNRLYFPIIYND